MAPDAELRQNEHRTGESPQPNSVRGVAFLLLYPIRHIDPPHAITGGSFFRAGRGFHGGLSPATQVKPPNRYVGGSVLRQDRARTRGCLTAQTNRALSPRNPVPPIGDCS